MLTRKCTLNTKNLKTGLELSGGCVSSLMVPLNEIMNKQLLVASFMIIWEYKQSLLSGS